MNIKTILRSYVVIFISTTLVCSDTHFAPDHAEFKHGGASVLPIYTRRGTKWVVLSREAGGRDKNSYDDFGGAADPGETPCVTAARECAEEIIAHSVLGKTVDDMIAYIDTCNNNTEHVIAITGKTNYVTFITRFDRYINRIRRTFYTARSKETKWKYKEKDRMALIKWNSLKQAIVQSTKNTGVTVSALVVHPKSLKLEKTTITLRPILVIKLRNFLQDDPYTQGTHPKVRFYHRPQDIQKKSTEQSTDTVLQPDPNQAHATMQQCNQDVCFGTSSNTHVPTHQGP